MGGVHRSSASADGAPLLLRSGVSVFPSVALPCDPIFAVVDGLLAVSFLFAGFDVVAAVCFIGVDWFGFVFEVDLLLVFLDEGCESG